MKRRAMLLSVVFLALGAQGCTRGMGRTTISATGLTPSGGKRTYSATMDGAAGVSVSKGVCRLDFGRHRLYLEMTRILLNGDEIAQIPADASKFHIDYTAGVLVITADDEELVNVPVPN